MKFFTKTVEKYNIPVKSYDPSIDNPAIVNMLKQLNAQDSDLRLMSLEEFSKLNEENNGESTSN